MEEIPLLLKTLIELRKDQYVIKNAYRKPITFSQLGHSKNPIPLDGETFIGEDGYCKSTGISLVDPAVCSAILCNYSRLKQNCWGNYESDTWYLMNSFDKICDKALKPYPMYEKIVEYKIDGLQNIEIQQKLQEEFGNTHSLEYISNLWRKKIPNIIASAAEDDFLYWHYLNEEKGKYKRCSRCHEIKLAHGKYFSKNKTSKDGFYSICKACRNSKSKKYGTSRTKSLNYCQLILTYFK